MKYFRGDTFPVTASYKGYKFQNGDEVTVGIFDENFNKLTEKSLTVTGECDEVQLELSRKDMYNVFGKCTVEIRTITTSGMEMTIQKEIEFKEDGLR